MAVHHAVGISRQRNSGYRPHRVNIMAQGLSNPDPSLSLTERLRVRLTPGPLQATLSKLLTYCVLRPTQPPTLNGMGNE